MILSNCSFQLTDALLCIMFTTETSIRVRYAETDRMGYVYYGNYATYLEVARVEALRQLGVSYRELEDRGILLPVAEYQIKYFLPAYYDDELIIKTSITEMPGVKIKFSYEIYKEDKVISKASTDLVFVEKTSMRPTRCPNDIADKLKHYF